MKPRAAAAFRSRGRATLTGALALAGVAAPLLAGAPPAGARAGVRPLARAATRYPTSAASFFSAPGLEPMRVDVEVSRPGRAGGFIFVDPFKDFAVHMPMVGQVGPMILDARGRAVWVHPVGGGELAFDFRPQVYRGQPVLTWWQGKVRATTKQPVGLTEPGGRYYIYNDHYQLLKSIVAQEGWSADEHDLVLTPQGTALFPVVKEVPLDQSSIGGPANGTAEDAGVQEVDVETGKLLYQWNMAQHVSLSETDVKPAEGTVWDPFHLNSVEELADGNLLISARNTSAVYEIERSTGNVLWQLGGKGSTFQLAPEARFSWQHDARALPGNEVSVFDDACCNLLPGGGAEPAEHHARALVLKLDFANDTASVAAQYQHHPPIDVPSQGNAQTLPDGNVFVGWGQLPSYSEYTPGGKLLYNVTLPAADESYRAYRFPWSGMPLTRPSVVLRRRHGSDTLYVSWNGATGVTRWEVLAGAGRGRLRPFRRAGRNGFETAIGLGSPTARAFEVKALDAHGRVLGSSRVVRR